ncbi:hypothetical protein H5410_016680 [Solanum commersonii]|uniref:Uncharacterized protein n=1 Tax=Solanum commersonii TaxID=4109 RepID=A0A9J5ZX88_SOLCO|nr:hypothetical protein H5410_016680 [Solanum commersonii]
MDLMQADQKLRETLQIWSKLSFGDYWPKKLRNPTIREGNRVTHHLANEARNTNTNDNFVIFPYPHTMLTTTLAIDLAGRTH